MLVVNPRGYLETGRRTSILRRIVLRSRFKEQREEPRPSGTAGLHLGGKTNLYRKASALRVHVSMVTAGAVGCEKTRSKRRTGQVRGGRNGGEELTDKEHGP